MGFLEERDLSSVPSIPEFYKGKVIFITGGSGFMGQVLIEKLLYSCSDLERIYLLIRPKRDVKIEQRLVEMYKSPLFDRLRKERLGLFEEKVSAIPGDIAKVDLGLSKENEELLKNSVNIVFHCAASVRFNDTLVDATFINLRSTRDLVNLAKEMKKLLVFVHVSTCYANTNYGQFLEERMYPPHANWRDTLNICETLDVDIINRFTPKYLGNLPNTYVFTKQLAEHLVYENQGKLPLVIVRPSVVISTCDEPLDGWVDNYNGPVGLCIGVGTGIIRDILGYEELLTDYIPVDYCIKHFITAAWIRGTKPLEPTDPVAIYSCSSYKDLRISLGDLCRIGVERVHEFPLENMIRAPKVTLTVSPTFHYIKFMLYQLLPSIFIDLILWLSGKKTKLVKVQRRIYHVDTALEFYLSNYWHFDNRNFCLLQICIKEQDKKQFDYDLKKVNKRNYIRKAILGGKIYLLRESLVRSPETKKRLYFLKISSIILKLLFFVFFVWILATTYFQSTVEHVLRIKAF